MKTQQGGFTLIELVVVIVILGILAAVATPRFSALTGDAETATAEGALGAFASQAVILLAEFDGVEQSATDVEAALIYDTVTISFGGECATGITATVGGTTVTGPSLTGLCTGSL
ncbi:MAG: type II secretion system protein [Gammaproteobacteria bacterium]